MKDDERPVTITAYFAVFEQKLDRLRQDIKISRKHKDRKEHVKKCIQEAKELKKMLRQAKPSPEHIIELTIDGIHTEVTSVSEGLSVTPLTSNKVGSKVVIKLLVTNL